MLNYVTNRVTVLGGDSSFLRVYFTKDRKGHPFFDFNRIIPMPETLNIDCGSQGVFGYDLFYTEDDKRIFSTYPWLEREVIRYRKKHPECYLLSHLSVARKIYFDTPEEELGEIYAKNKAHHGFFFWSEWCTAHWGTKWNAHKTEILDDSFSDFAFLTINTPPIPVLEQVAIRNPDLEFIVGYCDSCSTLAGYKIFKEGLLLQEKNVNADDSIFCNAVSKTKSIFFDDGKDECKEKTELKDYTSVD